MIVAPLGYLNLHVQTMVAAGIHQPMAAHGATLPILSASLVLLHQIKMQSLHGRALNTRTLYRQ